MSKPFIDNRSEIPIYIQLLNYFKSAIINNELKENEQMPSIRALAKELHISVVTTQRAFQELENEGYIYTIPARGCFVAKKNIELVKEQNLSEIEEHLTIVKQLAALNGLGIDDVISIIKIIYSEG